MELLREVGVEAITVLGFETLVGSESESGF